MCIKLFLPFISLPPLQLASIYFRQGFPLKKEKEKKTQMFEFTIFMMTKGVVSHKPLAYNKK